jgi:hypothetical protein
LIWASNEWITVRQHHTLSIAIHYVTL